MNEDEDRKAFEEHYSYAGLKIYVGVPLSTLLRRQRQDKIEVVKHSPGP